MAKARYQDYVRLVRGFNTFNRLLRCDCINGYSVGLKMTGGELTNKICIVVYVNQKVGLRRLPIGNRIPSTFRMPTDRTRDGYLEFLTDVQQVRFAAVENDQKLRPAPSGISIGHVDVTAGTLGGLVRDKETGDTVILSNNHVIADSNNAATGDPIIQPGAADGGQFPRDHIAELTRFVPVQFGGAENRVDAAIAKPLDPEDVAWETLEIGPQTPAATRRLGEDDLGLAVRKTGRTTETTEGFVQALYGTIQVQYSTFNKATFVDQIIISQPADAPDFSMGGDSGSLVYDFDDNLIGLLFAGGPGSLGQPATTVINPIRFVLDELNIETLSVEVPPEPPDPCEEILEVVQTAMSWLTSG